MCFYPAPLIQLISQFKPRKPVLQTMLQVQMRPSALEHPAVGMRLRFHHAAVPVAIHQTIYSVHKTVSQQLQGTQNKDVNRLKIFNPIPGGWVEPYPGIGLNLAPGLG